MRRKSSKPTSVVTRAVYRPKKTVQVAKQPVKSKKKGHKGLFAALGGIAGGYLGGPLGARIGYKAGDLLSTITGHGSYTVNQNSLVKGNSIPTFRLATEGVEIAHREYIGDIVGSTGFSLTAYAINPGNSSIFPWLSTIATSFEEYDLLGLVFEYRPSSGSAVSSTSAALGTVVFATDYNVLAPNFINKQQMESYEFSSSVVPDSAMIHPVECAPKSNVLNTMYVRTGAVPAGADPRFYDVGEFQAATVGMQSAYTVGELWTSYHLRLKKPRLPFNGEALRTWAHVVSSPLSTATAAAPLGSGGGLLRSSSVINGLVPTMNGFVLEYPGIYLVSTTATSGTTLSTGPQYTVGSNIAGAPQILNNATLATQSIREGGSAAGEQLLTVSARGTGAANTVTLGGLGAMTGGNVDILVCLLPNTVNATRPLFDYFGDRPRQGVAIDRRFSFMHISDNDALFPGIDERKVSSG